MKRISWLGWPALAVLFFVVESTCLLRYYFVNVSPFPAENYDQALYLVQTYDATAGGLRAIARKIVTSGPQSSLFMPEAALLCLIFGVSRLSVLLLNYLAFMVSAATLFFAVRFTTRSLALAIGSVALLLSTHTLWFWAGGLFDFRMDWMASCAYGIWCCVVLRSKVFADRRWTLLAVAAACFMMLNRYVTAAYVFGVEFPLLLLVFAFEFYQRRLVRTYNLLLAVGAQILVVAPFIYANRKSIHDYYVVGHLTGGENKIRAQEAGVSSLADNLLYYPRSIMNDHLGLSFFIMSGVFLIFAAAMSLRVRQHGTQPPRSSRLSLFVETIFILGAIFAPLTALTYDLSKSPVVGGVVDLPIILLVVLLCRWAGLQPAQDRAIVDRRQNYLASLFLLAGLALQIKDASLARDATQRTEFQKWNLNVETVVLDALEDHKRIVHLTTNAVTPYIVPAVFSVASDELGHPDQKFDWSYAVGLDAPSVHKYMASLALSDYVILTDAPRQEAYPSSKFFEEHDQEITKWVKDNMDEVLALHYRWGLFRTFKHRPDLLQQWLAGSYGQELIDGRTFQWQKADASLKISKPNFPCLALPVFAAGPDEQVIRVTSDRGETQDVSIQGTDVHHPRNLVLPLPPRDEDVTFTFHALDPLTRFPNDGRDVAFGADQAHGIACPDQQ